MPRFAGTVVEFLTLTEEQRNAVGEKFLELGNIGFGALIFGSALAERRLQWYHLVVGALFWFLMFCVYVFITKPRGKR
jgi:hypothetical protein